MWLGTLRLKLNFRKLSLGTGNPTSNLVPTKKQPSLPRGERTGQTYQYAKSKEVL